MECWSCQAETHGAPICPSCGRIGLPAPGATHFDTFGLRPGYDVDLAELERKYRDLSLKVHPDRYAQAAAHERRAALEQTSALNEAWRVLKDAVRRAFYLLRLHGVDLEAEQGAQRAQMPLDFLEEVMALREQLERARANRDLPLARRMAEDVGREQRQALDEAVAALRELERDPAAEGPKRRATHALGRVRYFSRFLEEVEAMEEEALG